MPERGAARRGRSRIEFGDFQTPVELARAVCGLLDGLGVRPRSVVEPTCGVGGFLLAAAERWGDAARLLGVEVNPDYAAQARTALAAESSATRDRTEVRVADFFAVDWPSLLTESPEPLLVLGNPPWVTAATQGTFGGSNLPTRERGRVASSLDAITGASNFDVSQWMTSRLLEALAGRAATVALLLKSAVARRVLQDAWTPVGDGEADRDHGGPLPHVGSYIGDARLYRIDARRSFAAAVDACLLIVRLEAEPEARSARCAVYDGLQEQAPSSVFGLAEGELVADLDAWERTLHLAAAGEPAEWRSGVKHDCARVLELRRSDNPRSGGPASGLVNGLGEPVDVEPEVLFPLLKCTAVARGQAPGERFLFAPQRSTGDDPRRLAESAPRAWAYLQRHAAALDARKSRIYRGRPPFSIFGIGPYSFTDWKVAISGLHKELTFRVVGPAEGLDRSTRPVLFDDTVYFLPCPSEEAARATHAALQGEDAQAFLRSRVFWDMKRPVTARLLRSLRL